MSTQKNEHNPEPELKRIRITICKPCLEGVGSECHTPGCALFLHRVDLPINPLLYEVDAPPTDTTGSGREGETGCGPKSGHCAECGTTEGALVLLEDTTLCEECNMADHVVKLRLIDELTAQVEALRRDGERMASQCSDMRESLNEIANNSNYKSGGKFFYLSRLLEFAAQASAAVVADASFEDTARLEFVIQFIQKHGLKGLGDAIVEIYNASDVREFGREAIDKLRAAIDSAQRQEKP